MLNIRFLACTKVELYDLHFLAFSKKNVTESLGHVSTQAFAKGQKQNITEYSMQHSILSFSKSEIFTAVLDVSIFIQFFARNPIHQKRLLGAGA